MGKSRGCGQTAAELRSLILTLFFVAESVFETVNQEREKQESKEKSKVKNGILRKSNKMKRLCNTLSPPPLSLSFYPSFPLAFYTADGSFTDDSLLQGYGSKQTTSAMFTHWQRRYFKLYPDRLDIGDSFTVRDKDMLSNNNVSISLSVND